MPLRSGGMAERTPWFDIEPWFRLTVGCEPFFCGTDAPQSRVSESRFGRNLLPKNTLTVKANSGTQDASTGTGRTSLSTRGRMSDQTLEYDPRSSTAVAREPVFRPRRRPRYVRLASEGKAGVQVGSADLPEIRRPSRLEWGILRTLNIILALGSLIVLLPVILLVALLIKLDSPGPVFYRQQRVGLDRRDPGTRGPAGGRRVSDIGGLPFEILKFRSMRLDAEKDSGPIWAQDNDPRITRVGRILRRTRLDELPQFWNVLKGEMSIVGPRPERPSFVQQLREEIGHYPLRHQVPPGITGWAQVNRRPDQSVEDVRIKVDYDLEYLQRRSLWFDIWIMLRTLPVMFERDHPVKPKH